MKSSPRAAQPAAVERRAIVVHGIVQGVGFRPFVFGLATGLRLTGFVKNQTGNVFIEVEGEPASLDRFVADLAAKAPPPGATGTPLLGAAAAAGGSRVPHRDEQCGRDRTGVRLPGRGDLSGLPRGTVRPERPAVQLPLPQLHQLRPAADDHHGRPLRPARTTMASFAMCPACRAEYEDPADRRFHAQPTACADCGPWVELRGTGGEQLQTTDPLADFLEAIRRGAIGALKGLGGYHLVCDARNPSAVAELRRRKHRDEKPFAVMVRDVADAETLGSSGVKCEPRAF